MKWTKRKLKARHMRNLRLASLKKFKQVKKTYKEIAKLCNMSVCSVYQRLKEYHLIRYKKRKKIKNKYDKQTT